jgi:hypothetical protein
MSTPQNTIAIVYDYDQTLSPGYMRRPSYFVGFDFSGDALFEIDPFRGKEGREIKPLTVREILDEEISSR